jgi:hypothetical protein
MLFHLSHIDLDGFGCQMLTKLQFESMNFDEVKYFNANYGKPIDMAINQILKEITAGDWLLITDLNLTEGQADFIESQRANIGFKLDLWDHHDTGKPSAEKYDWYHLDSSKCATKITFEKLGMEDSLTEQIVEIINVYDMWQEENPLFNKGKTLNQALYDNDRTFPKILSSEQQKLNIFIIYNVGRMLLEHGIPETELYMYTMLRDYFMITTNAGSQNIFSIEQDPIHVIKINFMYEKLINTDFPVDIEMAGFKGKAFYGLSAIFQEFSHILLSKNPEIDFAVNVNPQGRLSMRSKRDEIDLGAISKEYFDGGGHPKAAGGSLPGAGETRFKDEELVPLLIKTIEEKESEVPPSE